MHKIIKKSKLVWSFATDFFRWVLNLWVLLSWLAGDFEPLHFEVFGSDTNITVAEVTKGRGNMKTFTLLWGGIPTKPIAFNASKSEVCIVKKKESSLAFFFFCHIIHRLIRMKIVAENNYQRSCKN